MSSEYITKQGDMFDQIAFNQLGSEKYTKELMEANPRYLDIVIFSSGIKLMIPDVVIADNTADNLPPWRT
jgi:Phage Tail Protein X.